MGLREHNEEELRYARQAAARLGQLPAHYCPVCGDCIGPIGRYWLPWVHRWLAGHWPFRPRHTP